MKFVYVLTSSQKDNYLEQAVLSAHSLKKYNPKAVTVLLTDTLTSKSFDEDEKRKTLSKFFEEIVSVEIPQEYGQKAASRWLKTNMPALVSGDLVYIDADTIITGDLSELEKIECDVAGVLDNNSHISESVFLQRLIRRKYLFSHIKEIFDHDTYINGGLLVCRDTKKAHDFFNLWHSLWKESCKKGVVLDQGALNEANFLSAWIIKELDYCWNAQVTIRLNSMKNAKIIHYLVTNAENFYPLAQPQVLDEIKKTGAIPDYIEKMLDNPFDLYNTDKKLRIITDTNIALSETGLYSVLSKLYTKHKSLFALFDKCFSFVLKVTGK